MTLTCPNCGQQAGRARKAPMKAKFIERFIPWKGEDGEREVIGSSRNKGSYTYRCEHCGETVRTHRGLSKQNRRRARRSPKTSKPMCRECGGTGNPALKRAGYYRKYQRWLRGYGPKLSPKEIDKLRKLREQTPDDQKCENCSGSGYAWPEKHVKGRPE